MLVKLFDRLIVSASIRSASRMPILGLLGPQHLRTQPIVQPAQPHQRPSTEGAKLVSQPPPAAPWVSSYAIVIVQEHVADQGWLLSRLTTAGTNNVTIADEKNQLTFVIVLELGEQVDGTTQ